MKLVAAALVIASSTAHAEPSSVWLDFGYLWTRLDVGDGMTVAGKLARFGPRVALGRHFHFGGELDIGQFSDWTQVPTGAVARGGPQRAGSPVDGTFSAGKLVAGMHAISGLLSGGAELALGLRDAQVSTDYGNDVAGRKDDIFVEGHGRLDYWLTPFTTAGAVATVGLHGDLAFGVVLGVHFGPYDRAR